MSHTHDPLTEQVLNAAFEVSNTLGPGFLEKIYERALLKELELRQIPAIPQPEFHVHYKGHRLGTFTPDILVRNELLIELKCTETLTKDHFAQVINYLKTTRLERALLINFQKPKLEWRRIANRYQIES